MNNLQQQLDRVERKLDRILSIIEPEEKPHILLSDFLLTWLEDFRGNVSSNTKYKDRLNIVNHINPVLGGYALTELTPMILQKFINGVEAPRQREHLYVLLKHSLRKACEFGYIDSNPISATVLPEHDPTPTAILSNEAIELFFKLAKPTEYCSAFYILIKQGLRPGELLSLTSDNVKDDYLHVTNSWNSRTKSIEKTKTKQSVREIPYFDDVKSLLRQMDATHGRLFPYQLRDLEDCFKSIVRSSDFSSFLVPRLILYSLRHTCITRWAESGVHPRVAMKWAGHNNITTTLHYYTHVSSQWENMEVEKVL